MSGEDEDLRTAISRHEREIAELQEQVKQLREGRAREELEAEITRRMNALETDLKFQELQETIAREEAEKGRHKRGRFPWS
jgi:cell division protein FtsL